jgi:hypothetical protein
MKQLTKVVMLPTKDKTHLVKHATSTLLYYYNNLKEANDKKMYCNQHAYVTVSQDVIGGKEVYYIDKFTNKVTSSGGAEYGSKQDVVIATTDPKLEASSTGYAGDRARTFYEKLPQIQQSALKKFVDNPDGEWEVEYCRDEESMMKNIETKGEISSWKLKLNQDNTVNITVVEKKMYTKNEVESLLHRAVNDSHCTSNSVKQPNSNKCADFTIKWIKENL